MSHPLEEWSYGASTILEIDSCSDGELGCHAHRRRLGVLAASLANRADLAQPVERVDALAGSTDECVTCHRRESPGIVAQYGISDMAAAGVACMDCHGVPADYPEAIEHEGENDAQQSTGALWRMPRVAGCAVYASRHSLPAYVAYAGAQSLSPPTSRCTSSRGGDVRPPRRLEIISTHSKATVTHFAWRTLPQCGLPRADGSVGRCQNCHLRHTFSLEQARKPETCNACHIGPDHPQWEIYQESPHGISYMTGGHTWNWEQLTRDANDSRYPGCHVCHVSHQRHRHVRINPRCRRPPGLVPLRPAKHATTRLGGESRPDARRLQCLYNQAFIDSFYTAADAATEA